MDAENKMLQIGEIMKEYQNALSYQTSAGFDQNWKTFIDLVEGRQWAPATNRTRNMPRPVFNEISFIIKHRCAAITSEYLKVVFSPMESPYNPNGIDMENMMAKTLTDFMAYEWEKMGMDYLVPQMVESSAILGTGIIHFWFDNNVTGGTKMGYVGDMKAEEIDVVNFFVSDPQEHDVQKQDWIIISARKSLKAIKREMRDNKIGKVSISQVTADTDTSNERYDSAQTEMSGEDKATVLLKYWRDEEGNVNFCKITGNQFVKEPTKTSKKLYPIAVFPWQSRRKNFYGLSETEALKDNQKLTNVLIGTAANNVQLTGNPKLLVKNDALRQQMTNEAGEVIFDYGLPNMDNIKYMAPPQLNNAGIELAQVVIELTRTFSGVNAVATGEPFSKELNASAIIALQNAAKAPNDMIKRRLYKFYEESALICVEFYRQNFNQERAFKSVNDLTKQETPMTFNGEELGDMEFSLKIDVGASSAYSEPLVVSQIDKFLQMGYITFEDALELYPQNVVPFRNLLMKKLQQREEEMMMKQQEQEMAMGGMSPVAPQGMPQ